MGTHYRFCSLHYFSKIDAKPQYRFAWPEKSCIASLHFDIVQRSGSFSPFSDSPRVPRKLTRVKWADVDVASFASKCNPKVHGRCDRYLSSFRMLSGKENFLFKKKKTTQNNLFTFLIYFYDLCIHMYKFSISE